MKLNKWIEVTVLSVIVSIAAMGCKTSKPNVVKFDDKNPGAKPVLAGGGLPAATPVNPDDAAKSKGTLIDGPLAPNERGTHEGWNESRDAFNAYTVHFDYDS